MLQSTTISQRLLNHFASWTGDPIRGRKGYKAIDLARGHVKFMASMSSDERDFPCKRRDDLGRRMSQCSWRRVGVTVS